MKKILTIFISSLLMISLVPTIHAEEDKAIRASDIISLLDKYVVDSGDNFYLVDTFDELDAKSEKLIGSIESYEVDHVRSNTFDNIFINDDNVYVYYFLESDNQDKIYYRHARIDELNFTFGSRILESKSSDGYSYYQDYCGIIGNESFGLLPQDFQAYIDTVKILGNVIQRSSDIRDTPISFDEINSNGYILLDPVYNDENEPSIEFSKEYEKWVTPHNTETGEQEVVYMVDPVTVKVDFEEGSLRYLSSEHYEYKDYYIDLNYSAPEGIEEGDYLNYELESISFFLHYNSPINNGYTYSSPQTGFATVAYATLAVVSAATAVTVAKKRRG